MRALFLILAFWSQFALAAVGATVVWEIRTGGSANNGGGFDTAKAGSDYSQQTGNQYTFSNLASSNATTTCVVTSASHNFVTADEGNIMHITAGTNWTAGFYEIISTSGNAATLDRACGSSASVSSGTFFVGGAYKLGSATDSAFFAQAVAGNIWWIKNDGTDHSSTTNNSPTVGTTTLLSQINGYNSTRGDNPTGSNRPVWNQNSANLVLGYTIMRNISLKGAASSMFQMGVGSIVNNTKINNLTSNASGRNAINCTSDCQILNSEVVSYGGQAINVASGSHAIILGNYIHDSATCVNLAAGTSSMLWMANNIVASCTTTGLNIVSALNFAPAMVLNNTFYGQETPVASSTGIKTITASSQINILNNIIYGWATGLANPDVSSPNYNDFNDFNNNTADITTWAKGPNSYAVAPAFGNVTNIRGTTATSSGQVLTDSGKNFSGVTDNVDTFCITASTGGNVGCYLITAHTSTTITADTNIGALGTGSSITYAVTLGHNFAVGVALKRKAMPQAFQAGLTTSYLDVGGAQRREYGRPVNK